VTRDEVGKSVSADEDPREWNLYLRQLKRWMLGLSLVPALIGIVFLATGNQGLVSWLPPLLFLSIAGLLQVLYRRPHSRVERIVRVTPDALQIGDWSIPRESLRDARIVPFGNGAFFVRITRRGPRIELGVLDRDEGRSLLRALGFDVSQTITTFVGGSRLFSGSTARMGFTALGFVVALFALGFLLESSPVVWALGMRLFALTFLTTFVGAMIPSRIDVGADGVLIRWLGTKRFLPLANIRTLDELVSGSNQRPAGVLLTMDDGTKISIPMMSGRELLERIQEGIETQARGSVAAAAALLARRDRDVRAWIQDLRAIGAGTNVDLRTAPVNPDHLWRIVESHGAAPEERAAAAVALGPSLDDGGKQRLRVAVEAVADERLRVAIVAAAKSEEGEDAALEEALGAVSEEEGG
jgi:hypothetical protein